MEAIAKLSALPELGELPAENLPALASIATPKPLGKDEDPLEKAAKQGVIGTLPERIVWKWLDDERYTYSVQVGMYGGRATQGGMVLDFIVWGIAPTPAALRVMGDYWHGTFRPGQAAVDDEQSRRLRADGYFVADLWEGEIYLATLWKRLGAYILERVRG